MSSDVKTKRIKKKHSWKTANRQCQIGQEEICFYAGT